MKRSGVSAAATATLALLLSGAGPVYDQALLAHRTQTTTAVPLQLSDAGAGPVATKGELAFVFQGFAWP